MADNTKYRFENEEYGKGRLVLAVIKSMTSSAGLTIQALKEKLSVVPFNGDIVLSLPFYEARLEKSMDTERRFFVSDPLVDVAGETFYVSNQWGKGNIDGFVIRARELGAAIDIIADPDSLIANFFNVYQHNPSTNWIDTYTQRCEYLSSIDANDFDFSCDEFLEDYWRSNSNGIAGVGPGMLSHEDLENIRDELPDISRKIINSPSAETYDEVMQWAEDAKYQGKTKFIRKGVVRRFFFACDPENLSTILNKIIRCRGLKSSVPPSSTSLPWWPNNTSMPRPPVIISSLDVP